MLKRVGWVLLTVILFCFEAKEIHPIFVKMPKDYIHLDRVRVANFTVSNTSAEYKAVEVNVKGRSHDKNRKEWLSENDDFIVIPAQFVLGPQQERVVSLKWVGDMDFKTEKAYRVVTEEVLFKKDKNNADNDKSAKVKIKLRFVNSFYVKPKNINPKIIAKSFKVKGEKHALTLENIGSEHQIVKHFKLDILHKNKKIKTIDVNNEAIKGSQNLLPGDALNVAIASDGLSKIKKYEVRLHSLND